MWVVRGHEALNWRQNLKTGMRICACEKERGTWCFLSLHEVKSVWQREKMGAGWGGSRLTHSSWASSGSQYLSSQTDITQELGIGCTGMKLHAEWSQKHTLHRSRERILIRANRHNHSYILEEELFRVSSESVYSDTQTLPLPHWDSREIHWKWFWWDVSTGDKSERQRDKVDRQIFHLCVVSPSVLLLHFLLGRLEACTDAGSLLKGLTFHFTLLGLGWTLVWRTLHEDTQMEGEIFACWSFSYYLWGPFFIWQWQYVYLSLLNPKIFVLLVQTLFALQLINFIITVHLPTHPPQYYTCIIHFIIFAYILFLKILACIQSLYFNFCTTLCLETPFCLCVFLFIHTGLMFEHC